MALLKLNRRVSPFNKLARRSTCALSNGCLFSRTDREEEYKDETQTHNVLDVGAGRPLGIARLRRNSVFGEHRATTHRRLRSAPLSWRRLHLDTWLLSVRRLWLL